MKKNYFVKSLEPVKKEMESIISQMSSGLITDEQTQKEKEDQKKQNEGGKVDGNLCTS